jgi:hypothetical protein
LVRRCEWETLYPNPGPLPQISHLAATIELLKTLDGSACRERPAGLGEATDPRSGGDDC